MKLTINSEPALHECIGTLRQQFKRHPFLRVSITSGKHRSLDANALAWVWYGQVSRELQEGSPEDVHSECKLLYGVPILRAEDEEFRERYDRLIKGRFDHEEKLELMRYLPVTSLMTTDQMRRYLEDVQRAFAQRGVILESE